MRKKLMSILICVALLLSITACGSSAEVATLASDQVESDVQEYLASFVDESAILTSLFQSQTSLSDSQTEVSCKITYSSDSGDGSGMVTLTYDVSDSGWTLSNCTADLAPDNEPTAVAVSAAEDTAAAEETSAPEETVAAEETAPTEETEKPAASAKPAAASANATTESPSGTLVGNTLTEVGTFDNPSDGLMYTRSYRFCLEDGDTTTVYGPSGPVGEYAGIQSLTGDAFGYTLVQSKDGKDENCIGLIDPNGELVIPCETAWIAYISGSERFVDVYYSTGSCTEKDDYVLALSGSDGTEYYIGYRKVFDLQNQSFVGDLEIHSGDRLAITGNNALVVVENGDSNVLYDANGNVLMETTANFSLSDTMATFRMDGCSYVYDVNGERFTSSEMLYSVSGTTDWFKVSADDGKCSLIDCDGNPLLSGMTFSSISSSYDGITLVKNADATAYQLIDLDGNILYEGNDMPTRCSDAAPGWWQISPSVGKKLLIGMGKTYECEYGANDLAPNDGNGHYTVLNTGETLTLDHSASLLGYGLAYARGASGKYAIYDLFTGTALTEEAYKKVYYSYGYVYAQDGDTWHVFQVEQTIQ